METITFIIEWLKEYGDVLGGIGSIFAVITLVATNGKLIMARLRGEAYVPENGIVDNGNTATPRRPQTSGVGLFSLRKSVSANSLALMPIETLGTVDTVFVAGFKEALIVDLSNAGFVLPETALSAHSGAGTGSQEVAVSEDTSLAADEVSNLLVKHAVKISIRSDGASARATVQAISDEGVIVHSNRLELNAAGGVIEEERVSAKISTSLKGALLTTKRDRADKAIAEGVHGHAQARLVDENKRKALTLSPKSRLIAALLLLPPFGFLGMHRFYIGRPFTGILYFLTGGFFIAGWIMDIALMTAGVLADGKGRPVVFWQRARTRAELAAVSTG